MVNADGVGLGGNDGVPSIHDDKENKNEMNGVSSSGGHDDDGGAPNGKGRSGGDRIDSMMAGLEKVCTMLST